MSNETKKRSLKERAQEFSIRLPFMENREKGEAKDLLGQVSTICDYGFLPDEDGALYAVFITKERPQHFFFGGKVLTDRLEQLEAEGYHDEIVEEGLPTLLTEKKAKNKRTYTNVEFYPEF